MGLRQVPDSQEFRTAPLKPPTPFTSALLPKLGAWVLVLALHLLLGGLEEVSSPLCFLCVGIIIITPHSFRAPFHLPRAVWVLIIPERRPVEDGEGRGVWPKVPAWCPPDTPSPSPG